MSGTQQADETSVAASCGGTGRAAVDGSVLQEGARRKTGLCPLCGGRVRLGGDARLVDHTAAASSEL